MKSVSFSGSVVILFCFSILGICQKLFPVLVRRLVFSDKTQEYHLSFPYYTVLFLPCTALFAESPSYLSPRAPEYMLLPLHNHNRLFQLFLCTSRLLSFSEPVVNSEIQIVAYGSNCAVLTESHRLSLQCHLPTRHSLLFPRQ